MNNEDIGTFQDAEINFAEAYHDARRLMGLRTTNMENLHYNTGLLYLNAPEKWVEPYLMLMEEIQFRINMIERMEMGLV